ncbi:hypothetical protein Bpfe_002035 [Biomphalaria pfeifferi]|uniref:Uncharacterized protein n=1 Tax=Biomphalaria pfeifferi TaxID=112525 RepID=A0AAD8C9Y0_BIOPF|nr:hypothetical protein Bpfe_002035 [Biomphalaria pfeifferi]
MCRSMTRSRQKITSPRLTRTRGSGPPLGPSTRVALTAREVLTNEKAWSPSDQTATCPRSTWRGCCNLYSGRPEQTKIWLIPSLSADPVWFSLPLLLVGACSVSPL